MEGDLLAGATDDSYLYADLESLGQSAELVRLNERLIESEKQNKTLKLEIDDMKQQIEILLEEKKTLENNIVSVYETALREIGRKDKEIASLKESTRISR